MLLDSIIVAPAGPVALCVFIPDARIISISSNLNIFHADPDADADADGQCHQDDHHQQEEQQRSTKWV